MLEELRKYFGPAILICPLLLVWGPAFLATPLWYVLVLLLAASLVAVVLLFKHAITTDSSFTAIKTNNPLGGLVMFVPFLTKGYAEAQESRFVLGRRRSPAGIAALYGAGMMFLALLCIVMMFADEDVGLFAGWSVAIVVLATSSLYSLTLAGIFTLSLAACALLFSFAAPQLAPLRVSVPFDLACYWAMSALCALHACAIDATLPVHGRSKRAGLLLVAIAASIYVQLVSLNLYSRWGLGMSPMSFGEWLDLFLTYSVWSCALLVLWSFAPVFTVVLARWVERNESKSIFNTPKTPTPIPPGKIPDTLARPILGTLLGVALFAGIIWFLLPLMLTDPIGESQTTTEETVPAEYAAEAAPYDEEAAAAAAAAAAPAAAPP